MEKAEKTQKQTDDTINKLVESVKNNYTASFLELLGIYSHTIVGLARSFSLPISEHEDLCQEGRMALYRAAVSYDGRSAKFSTYAITCMTNAMITFSKKYKADSNARVYGMTVEDCGEAAVSVGEIGHSVSSLEIEELLESNTSGGFSKYEKKVMSLKLAGYKVSEIAKLVDKEAKSVENTLFRARKKLKKLMER